MVSLRKLGRGSLTYRGSSNVTMADAIAKVFRVSGKKGQLPTTQQAIHRLRETEEMLNKKSAFLESRIEKEMTSAKKHGMKNKKGSMFICSSMRVSQYAILHMCQVKLITHSLRTAFAKAFPKGLKDCLYNYRVYSFFFVFPSPFSCTDGSEEEEAFGEAAPAD